MSTRAGMGDHGPGGGSLRRQRQLGRWAGRAAAGPGPLEVPAGVPVEALARYLEGHRLAPRVGGRLLRRDLEPAPGQAGAELERRLTAAHRKCLAEDALFTQVLGDLGERAAAAGVPLVLLKGADLASRLYRPGERPRNDVDLLVRPGDLQLLEEILRATGFRPDHPDPARARAHWFAVTWRHGTRPRVQVDLHWNLARPGRARWNLDRVFGRTEEVPGLPGFRRLERHDLACHLALHAVAFHGAFGRHLWWLDVHLLAPGLDEGTLARRARETGAGVAWQVAEARARELFGPPAAGPRGRAAAILRIARHWEGRGDARAGRWLVALLAVDPPWQAARVALDVARRTVVPHRGGRRA